MTSACLRFASRRYSFILSVLCLKLPTMVFICAKAILIEQESAGFEMWREVVRMRILIYKDRGTLMNYKLARIYFFVGTGRAIILQLDAIYPNHKTSFQNFLV